MVAFLVSIVPSAGALFLFWLALRAILQADRRERAAVARYDAGHGRRAPASSEHAGVDDEDNRYDRDGQGDVRADASDHIKNDTVNDTVGGVADRASD